MTGLSLPQPNGNSRRRRLHIHSAVPRLSGEELEEIGLPLFRSRANFTLCASQIDPKEEEDDENEGENVLHS